jgi:hypothetical protein
MQNGKTIFKMDSHENGGPFLWNGNENEYILFGVTTGLACGIVR